MSHTCAVTRLPQVPQVPQVSLVSRGMVVLGVIGGLETLSPVLQWAAGLR